MWKPIVGGVGTCEDSSAEALERSSAYDTAPVFEELSDGCSVQRIMSTSLCSTSAAGVYHTSLCSTSAAGVYHTLRLARQTRSSSLGGKRSSSASRASEAADSSFTQH